MDIETALFISAILFGFSLGYWAAHLNHLLEIRRALEEQLKEELRKLEQLEQLKKTLNTLLAEESNARARAEKAPFN